MNTYGDWSGLPITPDHAAYLASSAITPETAKSAGIYSITTPDQLPEPLAFWADEAVPAIAFPWRSPFGVEVIQVKPDSPVVWKGEPRKYLWPKDQIAILNAARVDPDAERALIVEGTKQTLAAASWAPDGFDVYGIAGCANWSQEGVPISDLAVVEDKDVWICLDGDVSSNLDVYDAGAKLARALQAEGAASVRFVRLPAGAKAGLDDVLAKRPAGKQTTYLTRLIDAAKDKPADAKPKPKKKTRFGGSRPVVVNPERGMIDVDGDRLDVINAITAALLARWDASRLFNHGEIISQLQGYEMRPLIKGAFLDLLQETTATIKRVGSGDDEVIVHTWPDSQTVEAVMSRSVRFSKLDRIARAPFIRPDGTVCQANGYDETTETMVVMDGALSAISIPEEPTPAEVEQARELLVSDWLGDLPFHSDADRANGLALVLTPFVRGHMDLVPMAVVDGLQMGVGKNLFADCVHILATGEKAEPLGWTRDDEETRKLITSAFRTGADIFVFDEAHHLDGAALARALTSSTYKDRQLGVSQMLGFPNRVTWVSLGNQVRVEGDITRRVYRVALRPTAPNPHERKASSFRHPELRDWTIEHRPELLTAALTLVRAWFAAGSPPPSRGVSFGSFEKWERIVGGIVEHAGLRGFLDNLAEWRSETNFNTTYWALHVRWLRSTFGDRAFTCAEARAEMSRDPNSEPPPGLTDLAENPRDYNRKLGQEYARHVDRFFDGLQLVKLAAERHGGVGQWRVVDPGAGTVAAQERPDMPDNPEDTEVTEETPAPTHMREKTSSARDASPRDYSTGASARVSRGEAGSGVSSVTSNTSGTVAAQERPDTSGYPTVEIAGFVVPGEITLPEGVVAIDVETGSSEDFWTAGPEFVRLAGYQWADRIHATDEIAEFAWTLAQDTTTLIVGHNIMSYDLVALARLHGLDLHKLTAEGRVIDTMLTEIVNNPPEGGLKPEQVIRAYSLDRLGDVKFGVGKKGDLKALAKEFGGFGQIPTDHAGYVEYLAQDVNLTARLAKAQTRNDYVRREHRVAAVAAQIRLNGFRVDEALLAERLQAGRTRRAELVAELTRRYDLPTTNKAGKPVKSPHATAEGKAKLAAAFAALDVKLPTTSTGEPAFGKDALALVADEQAGRADVVELVDMVRALHGERTVYETVDRYRVGDRVHPEISMFQASGRWSITKPGLTVMGKRGERWHEREVFLPEPGHVVIAADLAQVDARAVAAWCQDPAYLDLFEPGRDSHTEIALTVWGDASRRQDAKVIGHGWNYGMGIANLARQCGSVEAAREYDRAMRERFPALVAWKQEVYERACSGELLDNGFGRKLRCIPGREWTQAPALMGQGTARDLMMEGLLRLPAYILPMLRAVVHDEIVLSVPAGDVEDIKRDVVAALSFEWAPRPEDRPVRIEAGCDGPAPNWGAVYAK